MGFSSAIMKLRAQGCLLLSEIDLRIVSKSSNCHEPCDVQAGTFLVDLFYYLHYLLWIRATLACQSQVICHLRSRQCGFDGVLSSPDVLTCTIMESGVDRTEHALSRATANLTLSTVSTQSRFGTLTTSCTPHCKVRDIWMSVQSTMLEPCTCLIAGVQ